MSFMFSPRIGIGIGRHGSFPNIRKDEKMDETELSLSKSFLDKKPEKEIFATILFNNKEQSLGVYTISHEKIRTLPDFLNCLQHVKRAQGKLLTKFENYPQILVMIFKKQLEEIDRCLTGVCSNRVDKPSPEDITLLGRKIYYLVSKITSLQVRLKQSISDHVLPQKIVEWFKDVPALRYIPHGDPKACANILFFLETEKRSTLWEKLSAIPNIYQYCFPIENSFNLARRLVGDHTEIRKIECLDIAALSEGFSKLNIQDNPKTKVPEGFKKFIQLSYVKWGENSDPKFDSYNVVTCLNSTKKRLYGDFSRSPITDTDLLFVETPFHELNLCNTGVNGSFLGSECLSEIRKLNLSKCSLFDEIHFMLVRFKTPASLKTLDVSYTKVDGSGLLPVLGSLTDLKMQGCSVNEKALGTFRKKTLFKADFSGCNSFFGHCLKGDLFKTLKWLSIENCPTLLETALEDLSAAGLRYLNISRSTVTGLFFKKKTLKNLDTFIAASCLNLLDEHLKNIVAPITKLNLRNTLIKGECFSSFQKVEELDLSGCEYVDEKYMSDLPLNTIRKLNISNTNLTGAFFKSMPLLEELNVSGCKQFDEKYISQLIAPKLTTFNLSDTSYTGTSLSDPIFQLVENLYIEGTQITEENLMKIAKIEGKEKEIDHTEKEQKQVFKKLSLKGLKLSRNSSITGQFLQVPVFQDVKLIELFSCRQFKVQNVPDGLIDAVKSDKKIETYEFVN